MNKIVAENVQLMEDWLKKVRLLLVCIAIGVFFVECTEDTNEIEEVLEEPISGCDVNLYIEKDGLINIDFESVPSNNGWQEKNDLTGFSGEGYLVWSGDDFFNTPGNAKLTYPIKVTNTGVYRFIWRSRITEGTSISDFNDTWLRFPSADDFYGEKEDGSIVYPKGSGKTPVPEGSGSDGWFKVYMNKVGEWQWRSSTSDNDPHDIFVKFDNPGIYNMEISARSAKHGLDRFVLFKSEVTSATNDDTPLSEIECQ